MFLHPTNTLNHTAQHGTAQHCAVPVPSLFKDHSHIAINRLNPILCVERLRSPKLFGAMGIPFLNITDDELFPIVNLVFPAWALLALLPRWKYTAPVVRIVALSYSVLYVALLPNILFANPVIVSIYDFNSLDGLLKFFSHKSAMLLGWVHYIAFDLWTGM